MPRSQHTLTAGHVQHLAHQFLAPLLGTWPAVRHCTLAAVLAYAAARLTSLGRVDSK